jgi:hypothetical protein
MKILMITINDPAGVAINFTKAINKYTEHRCRLITKEIRYNFMYEKDIHLPWINKKEQWDEVEHLLKTSDIFHFHMAADENIELGPFKVKDYIKGKMLVHHHHGHPDFRLNPQKYREKYKKKKRDKLLVSTPDLLKLLPEAKWQPNLVPINDPLYTPLRDKKSNAIIISHSPTRRELKNTKEFIDVLNRLKKEGHCVEMDLIENTLHKKCLERKRRSHILFDHLQGYYGVSSLEGLSQGLCVIAGLDDWCRKHIHKFTKCDFLPWYISTRDRLFDDMALLVKDKDIREEYGKRARRFMEEVWNEHKVVDELVLFYES